jgi:hypothetical protein
MIKKTQMCDPEYQYFNGCHGICVNNSNYQCNNPVSEIYPGMCLQHFKDFQLEKDWNDIPEEIKQIVNYIFNPNECPLVFFELFIMSKFIPWRIAVKILLEPLCFWIIDEQHFAITILFGARFLQSKSLEANNTSFLEQSVDYSYAYVLDSICQILGWIMNGEELTSNLQMSKKEMINIKWSKITQMITHGFMLCLGANGMPRQIPNFVAEWQDVWKTRFKYWVELHIFNHILHENQLDEVWEYFGLLLTQVQNCASYAFVTNEDPNANENLQQRMLEYEEIFNQKNVTQ